MKKIIFCLFIAVALSNCEIGVQRSNANENPIYRAMRLGGSEETCYSYMKFKGMDYVLFSTFYGGSAIINLTKDELEVELLRKQISLIDKSK